MSSFKRPVNEYYVPTTHICTVNTVMIQSSGSQSTYVLSVETEMVCFKTAETAVYSSCAILDLPRRIGRDVPGYNGRISRYGANLNIGD